MLDNIWRGSRVSVTRELRVTDGSRSLERWLCALQLDGQNGRPRQSLATHHHVRHLCCADLDSSSIKEKANLGRNHFPSLSKFLFSSTPDTHSTYLIAH